MINSFFCTLLQYISIPEHNLLRLREENEKSHVKLLEGRLYLKHIKIIFSILYYMNLNFVSTHKKYTSYTYTCIYVCIYVYQMHFEE